MAGKDSATLRQIWRKWYKPTLDDLFREYESIGILLTPCMAIEEMEQLFKAISLRFEEERRSEAKKDPTPGHRYFRFDHIAFRREAHHYAVDLFYKTYYPRSGAPQLSIEYLGAVLELRRKGLNDPQIAERLGQSTDTIRKQVRIAEKRYREIVSSIRELGERARHREARAEKAD
jgi:hypothetical protein